MVFVFLFWFASLCVIASRSIHVSADVVLFYGWVMFRRVSALRLLYTFPCGWTLDLLPCPGRCKQCCRKHWNARIFFTWTSLVAQTAERLPTVQETWVQSLDQEDPLEKETAAHSSTLAWKIPWTSHGALWRSHGVTKSQTWLSSFTFFLSTKLRPQSPALSKY